MDGDITQLPSVEEGPMTGKLLVEGPKYIAWPILVVLDEIPAPAARTLGGAGTSPTFAKQVPDPTDAEATDAEDFLWGIGGQHKQWETYS